ncbi:MAG: BadF/BadG/BcrA/BcrD ATPase family protein [Candidatus Nealsonbacteria bacterium]
METKKISKIKAALGLDIGNGTIKFALITKEGKLIDWVYIKNLGVIETIKKGLKKLRKDVEITAVGTTGAGRKLGGAFIGADITKTEILAHAVGTLHFIPNAQTIFDLGQEDSKILILRNEVLIDFGMNQICVPDDTKITAESYIPKPIKDVKPNEKVLTHRGQFKKVKNKFIRNYSGKILKIKIGKKELKITPEHPVLALKRDTIKCYQDFREGKIEKIRVCKPLGERNVDWCKRHRCKKGSKMFYEPEFIQAKELKMGDFIVTPLPQEINNKEYLDWKGKTIYLKHHKLREVSKFSFTPKLLRVLGYYLAEGNLSWNKKRTNKKIKHIAGIIFVFNIKEKNYVDEIIQTLTKNFDVSTKVSFLPQHKTLKLEVYNKSLASIFNYLCGEYCNKKEIAAELMTLAPKLQLELVKGFFIGDGCLRIKKDKRHGKSANSYTATTTSEKLAHQLYWILLGNQIKCKLFNSNQKTTSGNISYHIAVYGTDINRLIDKKVSKRSPFKSFIHSNWLFEPIEQIEKKDFKGKVYNLKTEDDNSYIANLLTVHNCSGGCGAYLENVSFRLGIPIEKFGNLALKAKSTATISAKCAVFGTTSCVHKLNAGVAKENILSGVAKSLVRNYLALVAKGKDIKPPYIFQGGVALNKAVVKALEEELSHKVIVPKHAPIIGAIGAAILAQEANPTKSLFKGFNLANFQYTTASFTCHKCSNRCEVINIIRDGKKIASLGSRCGRYNIDFSKPR